MRSLRLAVLFSVCVMFVGSFAVQAELPRRIKVNLENKQKISKSEDALVSTPKMVASGDVRQGYHMVIHVFDSFGGKSGTNDYAMEVISGGQPSPIGISEAASFVLQAGYLYASYVMHGDANADAIIDLGDVVYILNYLFKGGPEPCPMEAGDANCDGLVDLGDVVYLLNYLFKGGPPPPC